jgi:hypothetical protein
MTLHERLTAAVEKRLAVAEAATPGPWRYNPNKAWHLPEDLASRRNGEEFVGAGPLDATIGVAATGPADHPQSMADAAFIAANDPARIIRDCRRDLKVLERHHTYGLQLAPEFRKGCVHCQQGGGVCAEIRGLAEAYEIGVDDGDG